MDYENPGVRTEVLPPGTQRIEDLESAKIILCPQPTSDPNQPLNWSWPRKCFHMLILCTYAIVIFASLTVMPPVWQNMNDELGISFENLNNGYATGLAALAVGCILFVPLALKFGRRPIYITTSLLMLASTIWMAEIQTLGDLIGSNFLSGIAGAVNEALFQVTACDLFYVHQRGTVNGIFLIVVIIGNYFGPVAAGYVAASQGWRWVFWYCAIFMGLISLAMIFGLEESKFASLPLNGQTIAINTILESSKTEKDHESKTADSNRLDLTRTITSPVRQFEIDTSIPNKSYWKKLELYTLDGNSSSLGMHMFRHIYQPFQILFQFPAVFFAALQYGWAISMLSILAVTQATLYPLDPYNFSSIGVGNMNIPPAIGAILGGLYGGPLVDYFILQVAKRRGGIYEPETRLWLFMLPGLCMAIGALMYGLTIAQGMPWIINAVGAGFIGFALGGCGDIALTYVQDSYQDIIGDALVGVVFVRNGLSTAMTFAITPWMTNMGVYNMFVLLGVLAVAMALTSIPLIIWGRTWRANLSKKYEFYAARQY